MHEPRPTSAAFPRTSDVPRCSWPPNNRTRGVRTREHAKSRLPVAWHPQRSARLEVSSVSAGLTNRARPPAVATRSGLQSDAAFDQRSPSSPPTAANNWPPSDVVSSSNSVALIRRTSSMRWLRIGSTRIALGVNDAMLCGKRRMRPRRRERARPPGSHAQHLECWTGGVLAEHAAQVRGDPMRASRPGHGQQESDPVAAEPADGVADAGPATERLH